MPAVARAALPPDDALREALHGEVQTRPPGRIRLPALGVHIAEPNGGIGRDEECAPLRRLPGPHGRGVDELAGNLERLRLGGCALKRERHTEFTRDPLLRGVSRTTRPIPARRHAGAQG